MFCSGGLEVRLVSYFIQLGFVVSRRFNERKRWRHGKRETANHQEVDVAL